MEKQRWEESEKRRAEERRSEKRKSQKKEDPGARKGRKVAKHCVSPMICGSGLAKAAGAEPSGQMRDEKLHAVVARSQYRSQNVQNTTCSDDFWKLRCRKSAGRCGANHISKSKVKKLRGTEHFWTFRCRISFNYNHHYTTLTALHSTTTTLQLQLQLQLQLNWTTLQAQLQLPLPLQLQLQLQLRYNYNYYYDYNYAASHYTTLH